MPNQFTKNNLVDMSHLNREDFTHKEWKREWQRLRNGSVPKTLTDMSDLNREDFTQKEWDAERYYRWRKSERGEASRKGYRTSEKGKAAALTYFKSDQWKEARKRYRDSEHGQATIGAYNKTKKAKATKHSYYLSEQGQNKKLAYQQSDRGRAIKNQTGAKRRAHKINAKPAWYNASKVYKIYLQSRRKTVRTGRQYAVDHIVPLQGKTVCGLHVEGNLRVILSRTNTIKQNFFTPATEQSVLRLMARDQIKNNVATYAAITL